MAPLSPDLRRQLERTTLAARAAAEEAARAALEALAVPQAEAFAHMTPEARSLRNHLRAHARQLSDPRDLRKETQAIDRLVCECAYEHWHRMLFARFLAENDLLVESESGVSVSLEECRELAQDQKVDPWVLASRLAQHMLPRIFRPDDPVLQVSLSREHKARLESLLEGLPAECFRADDALGWVYQFWRSDENDAVNRAEAKINEDTLPAVTQRFTDHYIVEFLLHNTLGAWWISKQKTEGKADGLTQTEWKYLRCKEDGMPAAGCFPEWPRTVEELKILDPCCGSGHFLVTLLHLLVSMRQAEEGLSSEDAVMAVLAHNLHGLEIDPRCTQIAAFNLALAAWKLIGKPTPLPPLNIACSGLAVGASREEWLKLAPPGQRFLMGELYDLFSKAPDLGSLINPGRVARGRLAPEVKNLLPVLETLLATEEITQPEQREIGVTAHGLAKAALILTGGFHLVATNVPYLTRGKQDDTLKSYIEQHYRDGKKNLATAFVLRCLEACADGGTAALVTPHNWLFGSYKKLREDLLRRVQLGMVIQLGPGAFETISGEVVNVALLSLTRANAPEDHRFFALDVSAEKTPIAKAAALRSGVTRIVNQSGQLENPDARISQSEHTNESLLSRYGTCIQGLATSDDPQFVLTFWELASISNGWCGLMGTVEATICYGGRERLIHWEGGCGRYFEHAQRLKAVGKLGGWKSGTEARGRKGVLVSQMSNLPVTLYTGDFYDHNASVIIPAEEEHLVAVWCYCSSSSFAREVKKIDQSLKPSNSTLAKVPFDIYYWQRVASEKYPNGLPVPSSSDPTQWLFGGTVTDTTEPLQVAVAKLLGYEWPEADKDITGEHVRTRDFMDDDGIVCIPSVRGEAPAADQLRALLAAAFDSGWSLSKERELIAAAGSTSDSLDDWLRSDFFAQHCQLFHLRPFIWHVWDGRKDGFHVLVNYHKLVKSNGDGRKLLESLTYSYLGDWIARQQVAVRENDAGSEDRLAAALELQSELTKILAGEPPYDLFIRWKPLHQQPIGWEPDVNDGVRLNIRPFVSASLSRGRAGAGVLHSKPNVKWEKDRGKEAQRSQGDFPWLWEWDGKTENWPGGSRFTGERFNACHYTNNFKEAARRRRCE